MRFKSLEKPKRLDYDKATLSGTYGKFFAEPFERGYAITIGNSYTANLAFDRNAVILATRMPAMPEGGDSAEDVIQVMDDRTGLMFEVALYKQFLQNVYHVRVAWGCAAIKSAHIATLIG